MMATKTVSVFNAFLHCVSLTHETNMLSKTLFDNISDAIL